MKGICRALCWTLIWVIPMNVLAADRRAAVLAATGTVKVNGVVVPRSYPVYAGDQVATEGNASVSLVSPGASLLLPGSSSIRYGRQVELTYGAVVMTASTDSGMTARLGNLSVTPVSARARLQMSSTNGRLALTALDGDLNVTDGAHAMVLRAGEILSSNSSSSGGAAGAATGAASKIPGWVLGLVVVGAMAAIAAAGVVTESGSPSPSQP